jgi:hypothetical protein
MATPIRPISTNTEPTRPGGDKNRGAALSFPLAHLSAVPHSDQIKSPIEAVGVVTAEQREART